MSNRQSETKSEKDKLVELREISKNCSNLVVVKDYIRTTLNYYINLLKSPIIEYTDEDIKSIYEQNSLNLECFSGLFNIEDFDTVLKEGNIREQITLLLVLLLNDNNVFPKLINYKLKTQSTTPLQEPTLQTIKLEDFHLNLDSKLLKLLIKNASDFSGLEEKDLTHIFKDCDNSSVDKKKQCVFNDIFYISLSNVIIPSRYKAPKIEQARTKRFYVGPYELTTDIFEPPLSEREKNFFKINRQWNEKKQLPIKSGALMFKLNNDSFFAHLLSKYNEYPISGPSGATDILYHAFGLFDNFDVNLFLLSCIAYMCNTPDHSLIEIILPCRTYGIDYTINKEGGSTNFINGLISKYINPPQESPQEPPQESPQEPLPSLPVSGGFINKKHKKHKNKLSRKQNKIKHNKNTKYKKHIN